MHLTLSLKLLHCAYAEVWYKETLYEAKPSTEPTLNDTYLCVYTYVCEICTGTLIVLLDQL